jgi:hypothetical protein
MKNTILLLSFIVLSFVSSQAQIGNRLAYTRMSEFKKTTTIVVLDDEDDTPYNKMMLEIIPKYWKISPYVFRKTSDMNDLIPLALHSMLYKNRRVVKNADRRTTQTHTDISLVICDRDSLSQYGGYDEFASIDLYSADDPSDVVYKLPVLIQAMNHYMQYLLTTDIDINAFNEKVPKFLNKNSDKIGSMPLYVCIEDLPANCNNTKAIEGAYNHSIRFETRDSLAKIIERGERGALLHLTPKYRQLTVMDMQSGQIYYWMDTKKFGEMNLSDFKILSNKAN